VVWLRAANSTTALIENLLLTASPLVTRFIQEDQESCLVLGFGSKAQ
jgi:predicted nuclease of predicted toxin-antitoxin system